MAEPAEFGGSAVASSRHVSFHVATVKSAGKERGASAVREVSAACCEAGGCAGGGGLVGRRTVNRFGISWGHVTKWCETNVSAIGRVTGASPRLPIAPRAEGWGKTRLTTWLLYSTRSQAQQSGHLQRKNKFGMAPVTSMPVRAAIHGHRRGLRTEILAERPKEA